MYKDGNNQDEDTPMNDMYNDDDMGTFTLPSLKEVVKSKKKYLLKEIS